MKKTLATIGATTAFAVAGLGLASVASAQTADQTDDDAESTESTETAPNEGRTDGRRGEGRGEGRGESNQQGQQQGEGGLASEQEALRRELEALARGLGSEEAARALQDAIGAMGDARDDLQRGENSEAVRDQMEALDALNDGADALAQDVQNGQGDTAAEGNRRDRGEGRDSAESDPFDRPTSSYGALDGRSTKVPDRALIDRARELMEELRRRSSEPSRPQLELEYLDRLMERF